MPRTPELKPLEWVGSSRADLARFPPIVRKEFGHALHLAQAGERPRQAKPLRGFGGAGVLELIENYETNTYRAVYTIKFSKAVFALHAFQKKSKHGIAMPKADIELIKRRLKLAAETYRRLYENEES
jgi:phage-related protein